MIRVPLPYPATPENYVHVVPPHVLPWVWRSIAPQAAAAAPPAAPAPAADDGAAPAPAPAPAPATPQFQENTFLQDSAVRLFKGRVFGSESVTFDPTDPTGSRLVMMDQYGAVWEAKHHGAGARAGAGAASSGGGNAARKAAKRLLSSVLKGASGGAGETPAPSPPPPSEDEFELNPEPVAWLGAGRPLGAAFRPTTGELVVCDALKGLLSLARGARRPHLLANHVSRLSSLDAGTPVRYCNDVAVSADGSTAYFTDSVDVTIQRMLLPLGAAGAPSVAGGGPGSSVYDTKTGWAMGMVQSKAAGRLLAYDFATGQARVLARGFRYANGVALPGDEAFVAVVETDRLRIVRVPLPPPARPGRAAAAAPAYATEGQPAGAPALTADDVELAPELLLAATAGGGGGGGGGDAARPTILIQNLPAAPDGIHTAGDGSSFWVSLLVKMPPVARHFRPAAARALMAWLPRALRPRPVRWGGVARLDGRSGALKAFLMDPSGGRVATISAAHEHGGRLYFGNLDLDYVAVAPLPADGEVVGVLGGGAVE